MQKDIKNVLKHKIILSAHFVIPLQTFFFMLYYETYCRKHKYLTYTQDEKIKINNKNIHKYEH